MNQRLSIFLFLGSLLILTACQQKQINYTDTGTSIALGLGEGGHVTGVATLEDYLGVKQPVDYFYTHHGYAAIRYECDIEAINSILQKIVEATRDDELDLRVSFAPGPLTTVPFTPLAVGNDAVEFSLCVYIDHLKTYAIGPIDEEPPYWRLLFEFNLVDAELDRLVIPIEFSIEHGGRLGRLIEFHNERRAKSISDHDEWNDTTRLMLTGSFWWR